MLKMPLMEVQMFGMNHLRLLSKFCLVRSQLILNEISVGLCLSKLQSQLFYLNLCIIILFFL